MPSVTRFPNADGTDQEWTRNSGSADLYTYVDDDPADDDTTYLTGSESSFPSSRYVSFTFPTTPAVPDGATDIAVTVHFRADKDGFLTRGITPYLSFGGNTQSGTSQNPATSWTDYSQQIAKPGGGDWSVSEINGTSWEAGLDASSGNSNKCTQLYVEISYESSAPEAPTSPQVDEQTNPTDAGEPPAFTAIHNAGDTESVDRAQVQVSENSDMSSPVWDSGYVTISSVSDGSRCEKISYAGSTYLSTGVKYYWRIRFKNSTDDVDGKWSDDGSANPGEFYVVDRQWATDADPFAFRRRLTFDTEHAEVPAGYLASFKMQTGTRRIIAGNGHFNESVQASGGSSITRHAGKTHIVYLGRYGAEYEPHPYDPDPPDEKESDSELGLWVVTINHLTGEVGQPYRITGTQTSYDTHYFPVIEADDDGYLHIAYGCHYNAVRLIVSTQPGVTGSLADDPEADNWTEMQTPTGANECTYPVFVNIPGEGRLYCFFRYGTFSAAYRYKFSYTGDNGDTWSPCYTFLHDTYYFDPSNEHYRWYNYGFKFDPKLKRLHLAWTHNHRVAGWPDVERGIWYGYCDYDDRDEDDALDVGFNVVRWADGTIAGKTDDGVAGYTPPTYVKAKAIMHQDDEHARIFVEDLVLTKDGVPLVFWEMKFDDGGSTLWADQTNLCCAKWSHDIGDPGVPGDFGHWEIKLISDQVNYRLAVRRSSFAGLTDRDGVVRLVMPVRGVTQWKFLPTGDVDDIGNVYPSTGSDNYACIDDGFTRVNHERYINITGDGSAMSFSHGTAAPPNVTAIRSVTVEMIARQLSPGYASGGQLYISDGTSDDYATAVTIDQYSLGKFTATWDNNPFESRAWQVSDLAGLEFGFRCNSANSSQVIRVLCECTYTKEAHPEYFSAELYEISSADDGDTWTARELSRNTGLGLPIMNSKHDLSGDVFEAIYCCGNDVFYLTDEPYGLILPGATDLRVFYGPDEIDRVIDYANLIESTIYFQIQDAISKGASVGAKDYYVHYGNWNASNTPLADPHEVFVNFFNFEEYDVGEDIDGVDGWAVGTDAGTATIYGAPPDHNNKVYGGQRSLMAVHGANDFYIEKTLGSGLTDIYVEGSLWMETGSSVDGYIGVKDSVGNMFAVGINGAADKAMYWDGSAWQTHATKRAHERAYHRVGLRVTASGCTGYMDGVVICDEISGISTVDKICLGAENKTFFDFIWVTNRLFKRQDATISSGFTDDTIERNSSSDSDYQATYDGRHDLGSAYLNVWKIELTLSAIDAGATDSNAHWLKIWVCNEDAYDPGDGDANIDVQIGGGNESLPGQKTCIWAGPSSTETKTFIIDATRDPADDVVNNTDNATDYYAMPSICRKSIKIDCWTTGGSAPVITIDEIKVYYDDRDAEVIVGDLEAKGFYVDAVLQGAGDYQFLAEAMVDDSFLRSHHQAVIGATKMIKGEASMPAANLTTTVENAKVHVSTGQTMTMAVRANLENLLASSGVGSFPIGYSGITAAVVNLVLTNEKTTNAQVTASVESGKGHLLPVITPLEYGLALDANGQLAADWKGGFTNALVVQVESMLEVVSADLVPFSTLRGTDSTGLALVNWLHSEETTGKVLLAHVGALQQDGSVNFESLAYVSVRKIAQADIGKNIDWSGKANCDWASSLAQRMIFPICFVGLREMETTVQIDNTKAIDFTDRTNIDVGTGVVGHNIVNLESLFTLLTTPIIPVEWTGGVLVRVDKAALVEWRTGRQAASLANIETRRGVDAGTQAANIESGKGVDDQKAAPIEHKAGKSFDSTLVPLSWRGGVTLGNVVQLETGRGLESRAEVPLHFLGAFTLETQAAIEYLRTNAVAQVAHLEAVKRIGTATQALFEYGERRLAGQEAPVATLKALEAIRTLPVEWQGGLMVTAQAAFPIEWVLKMESTGQVQFESVKPMSAAVIAGIESGRSTAATSQTLLTTDALAAMIAQVSIDSAHKIADVKQLGIDTTRITDAAVRAEIEQTVTRTMQDQIITEWRAWSGVVIEGAIPVSWRATIAAEMQAPVASRKSIEVVGNQVLLDWGVRRSASHRTEFEYGEEIRAIANALAVWCGTVDAKAQVGVQWVSQKEHTLAVELDYGRGVVTRSEIPFEILDGMIAEGNLSLDWIGYNVTLLLAINAQVRIPGLLGVSISIPDVKSYLIRLASAKDMSLRKAEAQSAGLRLVQAINAKLFGE